ncbi:MAG: cobyrinate a,c-diamide synthase [Hyphomicrobiales bacterium]|nr:cobyrinate a,c-diamide synthase [Hyphomicrobiales bacterium]
MSQQDRAPRGLMISAPRSGSGKTLLTLGLMRALTRRGHRVAGLKNGPDYIDPAFHEAACGHASYNLDSWAMHEAQIGAVLRALPAPAPLLVAEGSMGLFDGVPGAPGATGSSSDLAAMLALPVVLIVDVSGQSQSVAAVVRGFASHRADVRIAGLVLNKLASPRHERLTREAVAELGLPVLGALPRQNALALPERHLGLVQAVETNDLAAKIDTMADFIEAHADVAALAALAAPLRLPPAGRTLLRPPGQRIALARDAAFSFIYPHLLAGWRAAGAEIFPFSPLADAAPDPACDICWLPGGYPELHAGPLAAASRFAAGLRYFARHKPVHGECGGYMVLGEGLVDAGGLRHAMPGLLAIETDFSRRKMTLGYRTATLRADGPLGPAGTRLRGHEFHYAALTRNDEAALADGQDAYGSPVTPMGSRRGQVTGSFFHVIAEAP